MKKIYTLAALAMVAIVACNKEIEKTEEVIPEVEPKGEVTIFANSAVETKTSVDGLQVKWAAGDHIAVFDEDNGVHDFGLDDGAGTTEGEFSGSLSGKESGGWAVYPYTANASYDGSVFHIDYAPSYAYNSVTVPMYGSEGTGVNAGIYDFAHIGGAFKIQYKNVPASAASFVFTATTNITGTAEYDLTDASIVSNGGTTVTVTSLPSSKVLTFIIPVPAGTYSFDVKLLDSGSNIVEGSAKTVTSGKTVTEGHVLPLKAIIFPAANNTNLWSEDFTGKSATGTGTQASYTCNTENVFCGETVTYSFADNGSNRTQIYEQANAGGTSPELLIGKTSGTFTVADIPSGLATGMTLTFIANGTLSISSSTTNVTVDAISTTNPQTYRVNNATSKDKFTLVFSNKTSSNIRIDNIALKAGAPVAGVSVTTTAATLTETALGTTATINATLAATNGGSMGNVTSAGFYYKKTEYVGDFTRVTVTPATSISKALTGLETGKEYSFYAFASYNGGDEVYGTTLTFTPAVGVSYTDYNYIFTNSSWNATLNDELANWNSSTDGGFTTGQGVQITTTNYSVDPATATSPVGFNGVKSITVCYCTNASKGTGTISVKVGSGKAKSFSVTKPSSGGTTLKTNKFTFSPTESGVVELSVVCTQNSIYIHDINIEAVSTYSLD